MKASVKKLERIINKIGLILEDNLKLKEQLNQLKDRIRKIENEKKELETNYENAEQEVKRLMMVKHVEISDEERILVKKELKSYIKEIDKCLALLNK